MAGKCVPVTARALAVHRTAARSEVPDVIKKAIYRIARSVPGDNSRDGKRLDIIRLLVVFLMGS